MSFLHLTSLILLISSPAADAKVEEPIVVVTVDPLAHDEAKQMFACMRDFKARHRDERSKPENLARLNGQERLECKVDDSRSSIMTRLRVANPTLTETQLEQEFQKTVILAAMDAFKGSMSAGKSDHASKP
jgi:hypothetical protein